MHAMCTDVLANGLNHLQVTGLLINPALHSDLLRTGTRTYGCVCMCGGQRSPLGVTLYHSPAFFETGSLTESGAHQLSRLAGQQALGSTCLSLLSIDIPYACHPTWWLCGGCDPQIA